MFTPAKDYQMRKPRTILFTALLICSGLIPESASAQEITEFYILGGANYNTPTGIFADNDGSIANLPTTGFSIGGVGYRFCGILPLSDKIGLYAETYVPRFSVDIDAVRLKAGIPDFMSFDAEYKIGVTGLGVRLNPIEYFSTRPYLQLGMGRYRLEIIQYFSDQEINMRFEVSNTFNMGAGFMLHLGDFAIDAGARYHSVKLMYEGQPLGWDATWFDVGVMLAYRIGT